MKRLRGFLGCAFACTVAAAVAAGCGGTTKAGVSSDAGASLIRSGALAYVAVDSDLTSAQWQQVDELLRKFPGRDKWLTKLRRELSSQGVEYDRDLKDALGPELDLAAVSGPTSEDVSFALLTKPDSIEKAKALVRKLDARSPPASATRVVDGWFVVGDTEATIDRVLKASGGSSLADDSAFEAAVGELPTDAVAKAYVNGRGLADLLGTYLKGTADLAAVGGSAPPFGLDKVAWISAALGATGDGIHLEAAVKGAGSGVLGAAPYASKLIDGVPANALAFVSFQGGNLSAEIAQLRSNPEFRRGVRELERTLGVGVDDLLPLFGHETAFYARPGLVFPELSLVLETPDTQAALGTLDRIAAHVSKSMHGSISEGRQDGIDVRSLTVDRVTVHWAAFDGRVLVTTGPTGIADYRGSGDKLGDAPSYKRALDAAGAPSKTGGLLYLNLHDGVALIESYLGISGRHMPPDVRANLEPLQSLVAYSTEDGDLTKVSAFLEVK